MPENQAFEGEQREHRTDTILVQNSSAPEEHPLHTAVTLPDPIHDEYDERTCYNKIIDWLGPRQAGYIKKLRPLRTHLIMMQEALKIYQTELDRNLESKTTSKQTSTLVHKCIVEINSLTTGPNLNISPQEDQMLRSVAYDLAVVGRLIEEVINIAPEEEKHRSESLLLTPTEIRSRIALKNDENEGKNEEEEEEKSEEKEKEKIDMKSLRDKITTASNLTETFINYVDVKLEHRWWLKDLIYFLQIAIKIALLISAALAVPFHNEQIFAIVTLVISASQGIVEVLDQVFIKKVSPENVHVNSVTSMTKAGATS